MQYLNLLLRFYVYALHGCAAEVTYTAMWELLLNFNFKMPGNSHIWALFIYGLSTLVIEQVHPLLRDEWKLPLVARGLLYTIWTFFWEFSTGYCLRLFDACAWDYEPWFDYHVMGLITLEYFPLWFCASLFAEKVLIHYTLRLCLHDNEQQISKKLV